MRGRIKKALSGFYYVDTGEEVVTCRARGRFRKEGVSPLVGDRVEITVSGTEGMVDAIEPRRNVFSRPAVANIDQLVIVASNAIPQTDPYLIDRMTAIAALKGCEVLICINKSDLDHADELCAIYEKAGLPFLLASAETGEGIAELRERISGKLPLQAIPALGNRACSMRSTHAFPCRSARSVRRSDADATPRAMWSCIPSPAARRSSTRPAFPPSIPTSSGLR